MDTTRNTPPGGEKTQQIGVGDATRQISPPALDPNRTALGAPPGALALQLIAGNRYALTTQATREHALLLITAGGLLSGRRMPLNLCLVIDRSGSMEGEPLEYVKRACAHVVDLLEPTDVLSVVTFEEQVDVVMPARRVVNKALIKEHIGRIQPGNTTNLYDGIVAGASQVASVRTDAYVNRILVLTDGEPTAGIKDYASIVGAVAEQKSRGITVTALGFGPEYNEELLAGIAKRSGGNYYYISRPELIPEVFRKELETLLTLTARNLRLRFSLSRWVQVRQVYGQLPTFGPRSAEVTLADLERGAALSVLAELELGPRPPGSYRVARVTLTYDDATTGMANQRMEEDLAFEFVADRSVVAGGANPLVAQELEIARASRSLERTMMGLKTQQLTAGAAMAELQRTQMLLAQQGRAEQAQEVDAAIQSLRRGSGDAEKTLIGAIMDLDQGKHSSGGPASGS
jgi:Ca-activated chloride channel family protein